MFTPPEAYSSVPVRREQQAPPPPKDEDDHLTPAWLSMIDGIHNLSSKGFFISASFFISLVARIVPDAIIIQVGLLVWTVIFFWIQKPTRASQKDIAERRLTGVYIIISTLLINWDAILMMFFRPIEFIGMVFRLWQWLAFGIVGLVVVGLMVFASVSAPQEQERYF